jgi:hypothetical protein
MGSVLVHRTVFSRSLFNRNPSIVLALGVVWDSCVAYPLRRNSEAMSSLFAPRPLGGAGSTSRWAPVFQARRFGCRGPRATARALGCGTRRGHGGAFPPLLPDRSVVPRYARRPSPSRPVGFRGARAGGGVAKECYLVDPASSHMLVSKIKPCMCKYELIQTVKLRMAH